MTTTEPLRIIVAICTFNRAALLDQTLASMQALRRPPDVDWEIVVVNNRCTDQTDEILANYATRLPLRRLFEATPGHASARNHAVRASAGDFLIWTDDDVLVDPGWLEAYAEAFRARPSAAIFAGRVVPWFEEAPTGWVKRHIDHLSGVIVCVDHGEERPLREGDAVFGANMAVRLDVARAFPFDTRLGRVGKNLVGGDDTDFLGRVLEAGHECRWLPSACVQHFVMRERVQRGYITRWFRDGGRTFVKRGMLQPSRTLAGVPVWAVRKLAVELARRAWFAATGGDRWFRAFRESLLLQGILLESRRTSAANGQATGPVATAPSKGRSS